MASGSRSAGRRGRHPAAPPTAERTPPPAGISPGAPLRERPRHRHPLRHSSFRNLLREWRPARVPLRRSRSGKPSPAAPAGSTPLPGRRSPSSSPAGRRARMVRARQRTRLKTGRAPGMPDQRDPAFRLIREQVGQASQAMGRAGRHEDGRRKTPAQRGPLLCVEVPGVGRNAEAHAASPATTRATSAGTKAKCAWTWSIFSALAWRANSAAARKRPASSARRADTSPRRAARAKRRRRYAAGLRTESRPAPPASAATGRELDSEPMGARASAMRAPSALPPGQREDAHVDSRAEAPESRAG